MLATVVFDHFPAQDEPTTVCFWMMHNKVIIISCYKNVKCKTFRSTNQPKMTTHADILRQLLVVTADSKRLKQRKFGIEYIF